MIGKLVLSGLMLVTIAVVSHAQDNAMVAAAKTHVDANVPDDKEFNEILQRDITAYVTDKTDKGTTVAIELLRDGPTQAGVSFPKFYIWIEKRDSGGVLLEQAAARIAAIDKKRFEVIQYYRRKSIVTEPERMKKVFPADVYEKILTKITSSEK